MASKSVTCCLDGKDFIKWMTAHEADDDGEDDGFYISLHCGYPDPVYLKAIVCPFCGSVIE